MIAESYQEIEDGRVHSTPHLHRWTRPLRRKMIPGRGGVTQLVVLLDDIGSNLIFSLVLNFFS